jgi:hypothetical protein
MTDGDEEQKKKAAEAEKELAIKAKIDHEIAPKIAV